MLVILALSYVAAAVVYFYLVNKLAPVQEEPVWYHTAPPRSAQIIELFAQDSYKKAA